MQRTRVEGDARPERNPDPMTTRHRAEIERKIEQLSTERISLFARRNTGSNAAAVDRTRLKAIERELDECFVAVRSQRAQRDAKRFIAEEPVSRTRMARPND